MRDASPHPVHYPWGPVWHPGWKRRCYSVTPYTEPEVPEEPDPSDPDYDPTQDPDYDPDDSDDDNRYTGDPSAMPDFWN